MKGILMHPSSSSRYTTVARVLAPPALDSTPASLAERLSRVYEFIQRSNYVFGSPVGPFFVGGRHFHLHRFVYFGPNASDASLRVAFLAGWDHRDIRPTLALASIVEGLAFEPDLGHGLNLSFFPLVDVLGATALSGPRALDRENWVHSRYPELSLLEKDARVRGYHGFVRLESSEGDDVVSVRLRAAAPIENFAPSTELISSEDVEPFAVRWESDPARHFSDGPLSISDDLPVPPFELTVRIPSAWPHELYSRAAATILKRFVLRYRGFISYAQHL